jgi:hypothetical protein
MNAMPCDEYVPPLETVFIVEAVSERAIVPVRSPLAPKIATRSSTITSSAITKAKRKARKKNQLERSTSKGITGGYILRGRGEVRSGGAIVPIGNSRTCMADACRVVAHELKVSISERVCREGLRCALTDPSMTDAHAFMRMHGDQARGRHIRNSSDEVNLFQSRQGSTYFPEYTKFNGIFCTSQKLKNPNKKKK